MDGIAIRSTFITGFPGETDEQFDNLVEFIKKAKLDSAGFFAYSKEEDTPAYLLDGHMPEKIKKARQRKLYTTQKAVVKEKQKTFIGKTEKVVVDGFSDEYLTYYGRTYRSAPDVDGKVYFFSQDELSVGDVVDVKITDFKDYDLYGEQL